MDHHRLTTFLFRLLVRVQSRSLRLSEARGLWHEVRRFLRDDCGDYLPQQRCSRRS